MEPSEATVAMPEAGAWVTTSVEGTISPESLARTRILALLPWRRVTASAATVGAGKFVFGPAVLLAEIWPALSA